jgi:hypothetical protein
MGFETWQVNFRINHNTGDPLHLKTTVGTALINVPNSVTDADDEYNDDHGIYDEHGDMIGVGASYDEDNSPSTTYLRDELHKLRPEATLEGFEHINEKDVEAVIKEARQAHEHFHNPMPLLGNL